MWPMRPPARWCSATRSPSLRQLPSTFKFCARESAGLPSNCPLFPGGLYFPMDPVCKPCPGKMPRAGRLSPARRARRRPDRAQRVHARPIHAQRFHVATRDAAWYRLAAPLMGTKSTDRRRGLPRRPIAPQKRFKALPDVSVWAVADYLSQHGRIRSTAARRVGSWRSMSAGRDSASCSRRTRATGFVRRSNEQKRKNINDFRTFRHACRMIISQVTDAPPACANTRTELTRQLGLGESSGLPQFYRAPHRPHERAPNGSPTFPTASRRACHKFASCRGFERAARTERAAVGARCGRPARTHGPRGGCGATPTTRRGGVKWDASTSAVESGG